MSRKKSRRMRGMPDYTPPLTGNAARKAAKPRPDSMEAMLSIYSDGWNYSEDRAKSLGTDEAGYYIEKTTDVVISPEQALDIFCHHNYAGQRSFDQAHAVRLSKEILLARDIAFAVAPGGHATMVNGQHNMYAIVLRNQNTQASVTVYQCRDELAVARLFAIFDSGKGRTLNNALMAAKQANAIPTCSVPVGRLAKWSQCASMAKASFKRDHGSTLSAKVAGAQEKDVQEFAEWIDPIVGDNTKAKLIPLAIGAAFFAMFTSDRPKATEFIKRYISGANLDEDSPVLILRNRLINMPKGMHAASVSKDLVEMSYSAWRKFCLGEPLTVLRRTTSIPEYDRWKVFASATAVRLDNPSMTDKPVAVKV